MFVVEEAPIVDAATGDPFRDRLAGNGDVVDQCVEVARSAGVPATLFNQELIQRCPIRKHRVPTYRAAITIGFARCRDQARH